jgi:glycosyltransferase involved in cell wall biosynthesis
MIQCTVGVFAYNEEQNIVPVLNALLKQRLTEGEIAEIVVVASGCTDNTAALAEEVARANPIISVEAQPQRLGKAAAITSLIARARGDIIVLCGADTLPDPDAIEHLLRPFADPEVGMTGARIVPLNDPRGYAGFAVQVLWHMHHRLALRSPKLGELVAFRNVIDALPSDVVADEVALEALMTSRGYRLVYAPDAIVYNRGPETLGEFLHQRRRIFAGHLHIVRNYRYFAASMTMKHMAPLVAEALMTSSGLFPWIVMTMALEFWARCLGTLDFWRGRRHHVWRPISTTKQLHQRDQVLTLVAVSCRPGHIGFSDLVRTIRRMPLSEGRLFWWDPAENQVLFTLPEPAAPASPLPRRVADLVAHFTSRHLTPAAVLSYRTVQFNSVLSRTR